MTAARRYVQIVVQDTENVKMVFVNVNIHLLV
jgi:hypothetical protein